MRGEIHEKGVALVPWPLKFELTMFLCHGCARDFATIDCRAQSEDLVNAGF